MVYEQHHVSLMFEIHLDKFYSFVVFSSNIISLLIYTLQLIT